MDLFSGQNNNLLSNEAIYDELLEQAKEAGFGDMMNTSTQPISKAVIPKPGFCLKTKDSNNRKIFINVCHAENLPRPPPKTDEELMALIESEDPSGYRIPLSLGEPHTELDKAGKEATAYDVVINPEFFKELDGRQVLLGFLLTVILEGLENKYNIEISRDWKILKNRKFIGSLPEQTVRTKSKPLIMEVDKNDKPFISEIGESGTAEQIRAPEPGYTILQEPVNGYPEFLVAEIHLPKVKMAATLNLDLGEDRIVLGTRSNIYSLDLYLPFNLEQEQCVSQFNRQTKILTVTMPVQPETT